MTSSGEQKSGRLFHVSLLKATDINDAFRDQWRSLGENVETQNPYFLPWFLEPALKHLDRENAVRLFTVRRENEEHLLGLAPLIIGSGYAKLPLKYFATWKHDHCFNGAPLIRDGRDIEFYYAMMEWIDEHPEGAKFLRLNFLPQDFVAETLLKTACHNQNRKYKIQTTHQRAVLPGNQGFETHIQSVYSGKKRKELRRQAKRFAELGAANFENTQINEKSISDFITLENAGWKSAHMEGFPIARSQDERSFFSEAMTRGAAENAVSCLSLTLDHKPVAMLFCLRSGDQLSAFKTAYNEDYAAYSPGVRLIMEATRQMLEDPSIKTFDSCAKDGHPVVDTLWPERLTITQINIPAAGALDKGLLALAASIERAKGVLRGNS